MAKTIIAVPCMDQVPARFAQSMTDLIKVGECKTVYNIGSLIYTSRNKIAQYAVSVGADYIAWFDSDMTFKPDTLQRLFQTLQETGADIVTGVYYRRVPPFTPVLFSELDITPEGICKWAEPAEVPAGPFEVAACGFGCVLLKTDVCRAVQVEYDNMFSPIGNNGEDIAFCWRARQCGYKIICDPSIECGHVGNIVVNSDFYENYRRARNGNS